MPVVTHLLWCDLETTGKDVGVDEIVEVGTILTDTDLTVIAEYEDIAVPSLHGRDRINSDPFVKAMHERSGLLSDIDTAVGDGPWPSALDRPRLLTVVEQQITEMLAEHGVATGQVALAGSGVGHFDLAFVREHLPGVAEKLTYWTIDVGVLRRAYQMWNGSDLSTANTSKTHRAMDDVHCHLTEARAFRDVLALT